MLKESFAIVHGFLNENFCHFVKWDCPFHEKTEQEKIGYNNSKKYPLHPKYSIYEHFPPKGDFRLLYQKLK